MRTSISEAAPSGADLVRAIKARALEEGFGAVGVCAPTRIPEAPERLAAFVEAGFHGRMGWMTERMGWRGDPGALWPRARSSSCWRTVYTPAEEPLGPRWRSVIAGRSASTRAAAIIHDLVKKRLKRLGRWLVAETGAEIKVFADTAPVMEKPLAQAAGTRAGRASTRTCSRGTWGTGSSWARSSPRWSCRGTKPSGSGAGRAGRAWTPARQGAFPGPWRLDARRCISYLTIEHAGPVAEELRAAMGNRIYGCDDCLAVCPWNKFAAEAREAGYWARAELSRPKLDELAALDDVGFRQVFAGSPIKRIGRDRFVRNVLYAIGNSGDAGLAPAAARLTDDPDPAVRDAAEWALRRLS
jgi:epoxyqueuosine reductase